MSLIKIVDVKHATAESKCTDVITLQIDIQCLQKLQHDMELEECFFRAFFAKKNSILAKNLSVRLSKVTSE